MDCNKCKHHGNNPGDTHLRCLHPLAKDDMLAMVAVSFGNQPPNKIGVTLNPHGMQRGWAYWPMNFDPLWVETCDGFDATAQEKSA